MNATNVRYYDLQTVYPTLNYDVAAEQQKLLEADLIILQFPFFWYGLPAHVKLWIEQVFTYGFAHGPNGNKLKGKKLQLSITLGGNEEAYSARGHNQYPVETFLIPLQLFASYCGLEYLPPIYSYAMNSRPGADNYETEQKALLHAQKVLAVMQETQPVLLPELVG